MPSGPCIQGYPCPYLMWFAFKRFRIVVFSSKEVGSERGLDATSTKTQNHIKKDSRRANWISILKWKLCVLP